MLTIFITITILGVDEDSIIMSRPTKVLEEEKLMLMEVASNGKWVSQQQTSCSVSERMKRI